jgi:hypothetical protein
MNEQFDGLNYLIQYRQKADGVKWHNMAAFDVLGAAESYLKKQDRDEDWIWEYRMVDLEDGNVTILAPA